MAYIKKADRKVAPATAEAVDKIVGKEAAPVVAKKTVEVNAESLEKLIRDNDQFREKITLLEAVADKSRIAWYEGLNPKKKQLTKISIAIFPTEKEWKYVVGWTDLIVNEMYQDTNLVWHERQIMELIFDDGTRLQVNYIDWVRRKKSVPAEIVSKSKNEETGVETLKVVTTDEHRKQLEIDVTFVNV